MKMKNIVKLDVNSTAYHKHLGCLCISKIDLENQMINFYGGKHSVNFSIEDINVRNEAFVTFNNISIKKIDAVKIVGYNDKVTLKAGDYLINAHELKEKSKISLIKKGLLYDENGDILRGLDEVDSFWWVNGEIYNSEDIIIPNNNVNQSTQNHEMVEFEPTTKDNIEEVLKYNNVTPSMDYSLFVDKDKIQISGKKEQAVMFLVMFSNKNWLQHLEIEVGKLKPLPKFDFWKEVNNNNLTDYIQIYRSKKGFIMGAGLNNEFETTEKNLNCLFEMKKLAEQLEKVNN